MHQSGLWKKSGATEKEAHYYKKLARIRPLLDYTYIPRFYGFVETNMGRGGVFDLILDEETQEVSKSLRHYLLTGEASADSPALIKAHREFLDRLLDDAIILRDLSPGNISVRKNRDGSYRFVCIDGIGHRDFIPLCDFSRWAARRKLRRLMARKHILTLQDVELCVERAKKRNRSQARAVS